MLQTRMRLGVGSGLMTGLAAFAMPAGAQQVVFSADFEGGAVPTAIAPGEGVLTGVQGFAGLGDGAYVFAGDFLRSPTGSVVTLTLTDLPAHDTISVEFLFAAIDSLDGTGNFPEGDFLRVTLDGVQVFRESFANATAGQIQSYEPAPGVLLAYRQNLGFTQGSFYLDSAYNMREEPRFRDLPHTGSSAVFTFEMEGPGIQALNDESWAFDELRVAVSSSCLADLNTDDLLNNTDVNLFVSGFLSQDAIADINGDGLWNNTDVNLFVSAFLAGC